MGKETLNIVIVCFFGNWPNPGVYYWRELPHLLRIDGLRILRVLVLGPIKIVLLVLSDDHPIIDVGVAEIYLWRPTSPSILALHCLVIHHSDVSKSFGKSRDEGHIEAVGCDKQK